MDETYLYQQIAESIRREILSGKLKPGDKLEPVRQLTSRWGCTLGTVQRAYQELARQGLIVSRPGQGTRVIGTPAAQDEPLRRANLVHRAESFLLEVLTAGYSPDDVDQAVRLAMDRWRSLQPLRPAVSAEKEVRFNGSHDPAITWIASHFEEIAGEGALLQVGFSGSLGGLIAAAEGKADLAGCHLWDAESDRYNEPFVRRLLPGQRVALVTLAERRLGLVLPAGNPLDLRRLEDLTRQGVRFANRQPGSGTRVWLDENLRRLGMDPKAILGYEIEKLTHSEVARAVAEGEVNAGLGLESAALSYGLDFVFLTLERYDLAVPASQMEREPVQELVDWLAGSQARRMFNHLGGYVASRSGAVEWVD